MLSLPLQFLLSHFYLCPFRLDDDQHVTNWSKQEKNKNRNLIQRSPKKKIHRKMLAERQSMQLSTAMDASTAAREKNKRTNTNKVVLTQTHSD